VLGCASPGSGESDHGDGKPAPQPAEQPKDPTPEPPPDRKDPRPGEGEEFTPAQRAKMEVYWDAFKHESHTWPQLRDEWIAMGDKATLTLAENLLRAMILSRLANQPRFAMMARTELIFLAEPTVPLVEGVLADPNFYDPGMKKMVRLPTEVQNELFELLLISEAASVPSLIRLSKAEVPGVRRKALDSLGRLKDRRGTPVLVETLATADHWIDRMTAARALGYGTDPAATRALVKALADPDETVVIEAARGLARQGATDAVEALEKRAETAKAADEWKITRKGTACDACEKVFAPGETFVSAIWLDQDAQFERRDLHPACFEAVPEEAYSRWVTAIPEKKEKKPPLDLGLAKEFLLRLVKEADPEKHKVALVLALLLLRKRRVKLLGERGTDEGRVMDLVIPAKSGDLEVPLPAPDLEDSETDEITAQLGRLFGLGEPEGDDDPDGEAPPPKT
jgi:hypothetical protein